MANNTDEQEKEVVIIKDVSTDEVIVLLKQLQGEFILRISINGGDETDEG